MKFELTEFKNERGSRKFQVSKFNFYFNSKKNKFNLYVFHQ